MGILLNAWEEYRAACVGKWFVETDKNVRLYCEAVDSHGPRMSYRPGDPIAVCPRWVDFNIYFKEAAPPRTLSDERADIERCAAAREMAKALGVEVPGHG